MKKILVVLMALLFTTGAFAADAKFDYNIWGLAYGAMGSQGSDEKWDYQHMRIRPMFTVGNENIKAVVRLQIDGNYGDQSMALADNGIKPFDRDKRVQVQFAYLELSNLFMDGLTLTTGLKDYFYPMIADTELALTALTYDFGMGTASFYYVKLAENEQYSKTGGSSFGLKDDAQVYIIDATIKAGDISIRPAIFYAVEQEDWAGPEWKTTIGAINASGDMGIFDFDATYVYFSEKPKGLDRCSASAFDVNVNFKPDKDIAAGVFATYTSAGDTKKAPFSDRVDMMFGSTSVGKLFLLQRGGWQDFGGVNPFDGWLTNPLGTMVFGVSGQFTMDKLTILAQAGYMQLAKKDATLNDKKTVGTEIDLKLSYAAAPKTDVFAECAYVMVGDKELVGEKNAYNVLLGLVTKI